jgi:hypothetical protein
VACPPGRDWLPRLGPVTIGGAGGRRPSDNVAAGVGVVGLPDVLKGGGIAKNIDRLFQLGKVLWADHDCGGTQVAGDDDAFVPVLDAVE